MDWRNKARERGFSSDYAMLVDFRKRRIGTNKVGDLLGISGTAVRKRMTVLGIPRMESGVPKHRKINPKTKKLDFSEFRERHSKRTDRELLYYLYWDKDMTDAAIAKYLGCAPETVKSKMNRFGIRRRPKGTKTKHAQRRS